MINVNWDDAKAYTAWLNRKTGHTYRLPSEAEWEYAARAGTTTRYHFGDSISPSQANYGGYENKHIPVGNYPANAFGLHDVHGNVAEWVEDCWNESYAGAPSDTNVWKTSDCSRRVTRGGSLCFEPWLARSAVRSWGHTVDRGVCGGFRIARTLP